MTPMWTRSPGDFAAAPRAEPESEVTDVSGDGPVATGARASSPLDRKKYRSMIEDYPVDLERMSRIAEPSPFTLEDGVEQTVTWLTDGRYQVDWRAWRFR